MGAPELYQQNDMETQTQQQDYVYEGFRIRQKPAAFFRRLFALCIDWGILGAISYLVFLIAIPFFVGFAAALSQTQSAESGKALGVVGILLITLGVLAIMALNHGYFIYFEYKKGRTPGKRVMGLSVVTTDGTPLSLGKCFLRELFRYVDLLGLPAIISFNLTLRKQRIGDLAAGTMVTFSQKDSNKVNYLYIKETDYKYFNEVLQPPKIARSLIEEYLAFAYSYYITHEQSGTLLAMQPTLDHWESTIKGLLPKTQSIEIDQNSLLLFFAELCHQKMLKQKGINHERK